MVTELVCSLFGTMPSAHIVRFCMARDHAQLRRVFMSWKALVPPKDDTGSEISLHEELFRQALGDFYPYVANGDAGADIAYGSFEYTLVAGADIADDAD